MDQLAQRVPTRGWVVAFAGVAINLCLGIVYAWSVWKGALIATPEHPAGSAMSGIDAGWVYLTDSQATWAYSICGITFALCMIPAGWVQDRFGPRLGATLGGILLAAGCIVAGAMKSYLGLVLGFGLMGGIGVGLGYAAATPAAVRWFGPHQRGLVVGLVVGGFGGAATYTAPLVKVLIKHYGISGSFIGLGILFAVVVVVAAQLLFAPPAGYRPPSAPPKPDGAAKAAEARRAASMTTTHWTARQMLGTWQFYALVLMFVGSAQSGLFVIANAAPILSETARSVAFLAANAWILASYGGVVNATGRIGTGMYSDKIGRANAYAINGVISAACLFVLPAIMRSGNVWLLFLMVGIAYWQYGGGLSLMPAITADFFGAKDLGLKYGLVFLGWGTALFMPQASGYIKDLTGSMDYAFYLSGALLVAAVLLSRVVKRPLSAEERSPNI